MVEVLENSIKLVIKLSHSLSTASDFGEFFSEKLNVEVKKVKTEWDGNTEDITFEIEPKSEKSQVTITIRDDNHTNWSYHHDYVIFTFNGKNWDSKYIYNPIYH